MFYKIILVLSLIFSFINAKENQMSIYDFQCKNNRWARNLDVKI